MGKNIFIIKCALLSVVLLLCLAAASAAPSLSITSPSNNTNTTNSAIEVSYTATGDGVSPLDSCWYSRDNGNNNNSLASCSTNIIGISWLEGINNIIIWVNDSSNNLAVSYVTFIVDTIAPDIQIVSPSNNTNTTNTAIDVTYTVSNGYSGCYYSNDSGANKYTLANCDNITLVTWQGINNVIVYVNDSAGNVNRSYVTFTADTIAPYFTSAADQVLSQGQSLNYDINAADAGIGMGTFAINWTNTFSINSATGVLTNTSALAAGDYYINVSVNDLLANLNSTILKVTFGTDTTAPRVSLVSPDDGDLKTLSSTVAFTYNVTDSSSITSCVLIINGAVDQTASSVERDGPQIFIKVLADADYNWSINCTDLAGNVGKSSTYSLTMSLGYSGSRSTAGSTTPPADNTTAPAGGAGDSAGSSDENLIPTTQGVWNGVMTGVNGFISSVVEITKNLVNSAKSFFVDASLPKTLWLVTNAIVVILLIIVICRLLILLKRMKMRKMYREEERKREMWERPGNIERSIQEIKENPVLKKILIKPQAEMPVQIQERLQPQQIGIRPQKLEIKIEGPLTIDKEEAKKQIEKIEAKQEKLKQIEKIEAKSRQPEAKRGLIRPMVEEKFRYFGQREPEVRKEKAKPKIKKREIKPHPPTKKKIIKPVKVKEKVYKETTEIEAESLKRKIIDIEKKQRALVFEEMRRRIRNKEN